MRAALRAFVLHVYARNNTKLSHSQSSVVQLCQMWYVWYDTRCNRVTARCRSQKNRLDACDAVRQ